MELFDYMMQFLLDEMPIKDCEFDEVRVSLIKAVESSQYFLIKDINEKFLGFLTWEIRPSLTLDQKIDLGITNLVIARRCRGKYPLIKAANHLRRLYPNIDKFIWVNRKKNRLFAAKQKEKICLDIL